MQRVSKRVENAVGTEMYRTLQTSEEGHPSVMERAIPVMGWIGRQTGGHSRPRAQNEAILGTFILVNVRTKCTLSIC